MYTMKGKYLRTLRKRLDMTQTELAQELRMQKNSIARMERDESPIMQTTELAVRYLLVMRSRKGGKVK